MIHLKKFNENRIKEYKTSKLILDHDYIKDCFIDFVDNGKVEEIQTEVNDDSSDRDESGYAVYNINDKIDYSVDNTEIGDVLSFFIIDINGPALGNNISYSRPTTSDSPYSIKDHIKNLETSTEFYLDIDNSIDKVMIKYPNINYRIGIYQDDDYCQLELAFYNIVLKN
jgi:hypothetical protein